MSGRPGPLGRAQSALQPRQTPGSQHWDWRTPQTGIGAVKMTTRRACTGSQPAGRGVATTGYGALGRIVNRMNSA